MKLTDFRIKISKTNVGRIIGAEPESDLYSEIMEEIEEILPKAYEKIDPFALLEFGSIADYREYAGDNGSEALYVISSVGSAVSDWSAELFREGNYLGGMLADAIADDYLFQMDRMIQEKVAELCRKKKKGIVRRMEAPRDIPMSIQKKAYDITNAENETGLKIRESFMYDPVKTVCQIFLLGEDDTKFCTEHDCRGCPKTDCRMRSRSYTELTIEKGTQQYRITASKDRTILENLRMNNLFLSAVCGGHGLCGKCRVRVMQGKLPVSETDRQFFSEDELKKGYRLACKAFAQSDCTLRIDPLEEWEFYVPQEKNAVKKITGDQVYEIAVDLGTTTIAMQLIEPETGLAVADYTAINRQRIYGADVISRIEAANSGKGKELQEIICTVLRDGILHLTENSRIPVKRIALAANTSMVHFLMNYSCEMLGIYPFTPVSIDAIHIPADTLPGLEQFPCEISVCPGISTYVGGDIVAGLYEQAFYRTDQICVLIDLGTNGEIAVGNRTGILCASTAAGPAFEGGNIICGTGSIPGAISRISIENGKAVPETIGKKPAVGICGTGVIEVISEMLREGMIDETGRMDESVSESGFILSEFGNIRFYQKDVREFQLAKSAVRAGFETLLYRYGAAYSDICKIYVAGGLGSELDIDKAIRTGLFPEECRHKIEAVGNTSLKGAAKYLIHKDAASIMEEIVRNSEEVSLAADSVFQENYMKYMCFE